ncbi:hypothetical protein HanRHA438_Chr16g0736151 [Helianthus annuus]|uniref:Uncharacterized protein n=2 Tax=Helianthus annuus TaxID=4232 RepID=A0A9K3GWR9_HELAN|nr:hypothetical protein HanXRQr2_Chr16g0723541 [Helianthus annuus]KAJ0567572.1 hypothetical protein HanIR_Chr06g0286381 [Helianthus annuus]KAJ0833754.1 hypothetical protein HanRHA438_Chr16g0736151 [Helianthus annuus]KAJ0916030.1 hypothetical protein HanPSC8_Chr06g0256871 [Helianthus annuus]
MRVLVGVLYLHPEYGTPGLGVWNAGQKPKRPCFTVKRWFHVKVNVGVFQTSLDHFPWVPLMCVKLHVIGL